jgi:hypothetical protein
MANRRESSSGYSYHKDNTKSIPIFSGWMPKQPNAFNPIGEKSCDSPIGCPTSCPGILKEESTYNIAESLI